jgi:hypothetical protein
LFFPPMFGCALPLQFFFLLALRLPLGPQPVFVRRHALLVPAPLGRQAFGFDRQPFLVCR